MAGSPYRSVPGLDVTLEGAVLRLTLDRPERRNAIDDAMMNGLVDALDAAGRDDAVRAVALRGEGDHFCGGADIVARNADTANRNWPAEHADQRPRAGSIQRRLPSQAHRLIPLLLSIQTPVICAVQGWAAGVGFQLALAADFTIVDEGARMWEPFTARGFTPDSGATWLLPRLVGMVKARELLILGRELSGTEAYQWGLVHRAVAPTQLKAVSEELVTRVSSGPTVALGLTKWLLAAGVSTPLEAQLRNEGFALEVSSRSQDFKEGLRAFSERRPPKWSGR